MAATQRQGRRSERAAAAAAGLVALVLMTGTGCAQHGPAAGGRPGTGASGARDSQDSGEGPGQGQGGHGGDGVGAHGEDGHVTGPGPSAAARVVRGAADVLARAGTSRVATAMEMASGGTRLTVAGAGGFDYGRQTGQLKVRLPEGIRSGNGGGRKPVTELITPGALYMKNRGAGVPSDKWVRIATASLPDGNLVTAGATDPVSAAGLLRGVQRASYVGERVLDGEIVRHYEGMVRIGVAAQAASGWARRQLAAAAKGFSEDAVPFEADIDGQGRPRKIRHEFTFAGGEREERDGGDAGVAAVSSTTRLRDFGAPVRVVMPEPRDIYAGEIASP